MTTINVVVTDAVAVIVTKTSAAPTIIHVMASVQRPPVPVLNTRRKRADHIKDDVYVYVWISTTSSLTQRPICIRFTRHLPIYMHRRSLAKVFYDFHINSFDRVTYICGCSSSFQQTTIHTTISFCIFFSFSPMPPISQFNLVTFAIVFESSQILLYVRYAKTEQMCPIDYCVLSSMSTKFVSMSVYNLRIRIRDSIHLLFAH